MFRTKIDEIKEYCLNGDPKTCNRLSVEEYGNLLCVLMDKGLVDSTEGSMAIVDKVDVVHASLMNALESEKLTRSIIKSHNKYYSDLLSAVKLAYELEPRGSIQGRFMALGIAIGAGLGTALSSVNPAMISIGIGAGVAIGLTFGKKKEQEAEDAGKLF